MIFVLGAGGFIGSHLVSKLKELDHTVIGIDVKYNEYKLSDANKFIIADLRDYTFIDTIFTKYKPHEVYQLAADMGGATYINSGEHDAEVMSNSIQININVANLCKKHNVKKLFFASSACVYPQTSKDTSTCNEDEVYPANPDNNYGWEKLFSERIYKSYESKYGFIVKIARFHSIIGEYSTWTGGREKAHSALARKVVCVQNGGVIDVIGDGTQIRTFLHVSDCVNGILKLMNSDCNEILNIGSDYCISINEYVNLLKHVSGKEFTINYIPGATGVIQRYCNISKAKLLLDWQPLKTLEESTRLVYNWIQTQLSEKNNVLYVIQPNGTGKTGELLFCGIGIKGQLFINILKNSKKYNIIPCYVSSNAELEVEVLKYNPKIIIYNYNHVASTWFTDSSLRNKYPNIYHILKHYDITQKLVTDFVATKFLGFNYFISDDNTLIGSDNVFITPRAIPEQNIISAPANIVPRIGFQGFAQPHKGILKLVSQVINEFDTAVIRLHLPLALYIHNHQRGTIAIMNAALDLVKNYPKINIEINHDFLDDEGIVTWLNQNDVNCYFYDYMDGCGIASSPDYAIAAKKPIAISNSHMFRNFNCISPSIIVSDTNKIKDIMSRGIEPLKPLYTQYSHQNLIKAHEVIFDKLLA